MDVREKLVEIVCDAMEADGCIGHCNHPPCFPVERVVNALIENGVTVQDESNEIKQLKNQVVALKKSNRNWRRKVQRMRNSPHPPKGE